jgi:hypothetical protein
MVGEHGRELVRLPFGSTVIPNGTSEVMMAGGNGGYGAQGGNGGPAMLLLGSDGSRVADALVFVIAQAVRDKGGRADVLGIKT